MAGVGKTQTALEYVYSNEESYNRIYWISAMDQASLLSGYQKIADEAGIVTQSSNLIAVSNAVLQWLRREESWLLVIDNLDDITIVDGFLPENGPKNHTLITTRNPNSEGIPAEGLEVPLFDHEEAITLLSVRSKINIPPHSSEMEQAKMIIKDLQSLPLAIEQAAAHIRVVTGDFTAYLEEYHKDHRGINQWVPPGNKQYPYSVAKTFSISFDVVKRNNPQAANLLRLLSYLNPDGILLEFLAAGADALESDLRKVISVPSELAKALLELETFSLIKWDRRSKIISLHRLVQTVIIDEMTCNEITLTVAEIVHLMDKSFPTDVTNETRSLCRRYQGQVLEPLLRTDANIAENAVYIKWRVANFLQDDGKYIDCERLFRQVIKTLTQLLGPRYCIWADVYSRTHRRSRDAAGGGVGEEEEDPGRGAPRHMHNLGWTYMQQGRAAEAATLQEEVLEKRRRILGEEHPDTLRAMNNLGWTYLQQGRAAEAATLQEEVLEKSRRILGEEHPDTLGAMNNLGSTYLQQGRAAEAATLQEEVLEKSRRINDND